MKIMSKAEFAALSAWGKGYAVYMAGMREDQPNIPAHYTPSPDERADYKAGQRAAVIEAQDMP